MTQNRRTKGRCKQDVEKTTPFSLSKEQREHLVALTGKEKCRDFSKLDRSSFGVNPVFLFSEDSDSLYVAYQEANNGGE